jgi:hypothetical protein
MVLREVDGQFMIERSILFRKSVRTLILAENMIKEKNDEKKDVSHSGGILTT